MLFIIFFSVIPTFLPKYFWFNPLGGHTVVWFIVLYFTGAFLRLNEEFLKRIKIIFLIFGYFAVTLIMYAGVIGLPFLLNRFHIDSNLPGKLLSYNSPLVYSAAVLLFLIFSRLQIKWTWISAVAPLTFGIYLIHDHNSVRNILWHQLVQTQNWHNSVWFVPVSLMQASAVFVCCAVIVFVIGKAEKYMANINRN